MSGIREPKRREATIRRREDILNAALATFGSKGFKNGPLTEIAEQVDMTHAGILHHFGSKDQLLLEVLSYRDETDVAHLENHHMPNGIDLFKHLIKTAKLNMDRAGIVQAYAVLSAEAVTNDHPARDYFQGRYSTLRREVGEAFEILCRERGASDERAIELGSAAILAVMDGLQVQWLLDPDALDLGAATEFAIQGIVDAVLNPRASELGS
jgi:AcrR family transcriptional regulator